MHLRALFAPLVLGLALAACAGPSALRPARSGDIAALRTALQDDLRAGRLTRSGVVDIAVELAEHELRSAKDSEALRRVQQVRMCARHLEAPLRERSEGTDSAAPLAALALLEVGKGDPDAWGDRATDSDPAWRAVGIRTLTDIESGKHRRAAMADPDERVRLSAVRAAEDAADPGDVTSLLEVARLDPDSLVRVTAVRSLGLHGSEDTVLRLKDLYLSAPEPVRQEIVSAWSWPSMLEAGGRRELITVAETGKGFPAIIAGGILVRLAPDTRGYGLSALMKQFDTGTARERALAITLAPLDDDAVRKAVQKEADSKDPEVRIAALSKLARDPKDGKASMDALGSIAASNTPAASRARAAMARLGDARVTTLLLRDAQSKEPAPRKDAVRGLVDLGDIARAALFLADDDAGVRMLTVCEILNASDRW